MMLMLSEVIDNFFEERRAARYSKYTLLDYKNTYTKFRRFLGGDIQFEDIDELTITRFMASDIVAAVSDKTALNYHTGLSSLWSWAVKKKIVTHNVVRLVKPPKPEKRVIYPFARQDILDLLMTASEGKQSLRDQSIILLLLDTGIRASEICNLRIKDVYLDSRKMLVFGKGKKERILMYSQPTQHNMLNYLGNQGIKNYRKSKYQSLFLTMQGKPMCRDSLRQLLERLGERSGVVKCHAHRFRHTFAIEFLRNGGNIYTLQMILGHTSLDMVKRYLQIAQLDLDRDHERASPVKRWDLKSEINI